MPFANGDPLTLTEQGLYCPQGDFHIDPWKPVPRAVTTHTHADHIGFGSQSFLCSTTSERLLHTRVATKDPSDSPTIETLPFNTPTRIGDVILSLHPAGHVLGSAQVKLQPAPGTTPFPTTVVTGDYRPPSPPFPPSPSDLPHTTTSHTPPNTNDNPTAEPFEPVPCHLLITESTFGLPIFRWPNPLDVANDINTWWADNAREQRTTVLFAYALGKAQRVLAHLDPATGPIALHGSAHNITDAYRAANIQLPPTTHATKDNAKHLKGNACIIAPASTDNTPWLRRFKGKGGMRTAFVSGWMRTRAKRRWRAADRGFVLSDHADWPGLLDTVRHTGAERVGVTHGYTEALARYLNETNTADAFTVPTRFTGESLAQAEDDDEQTEA